MTSLTQDDLKYLSQQAIAAAQEAGQLIASYANKKVAVQHKEGGDSYAAQVLTEVDLLSEKIIVSTLKPTCERFDLAMLTEESVDDRARLEKDYFWCVDPMDGTLSFIEARPGYAVSIALVSKSGEPIIGVVYDPVSHATYSAVRGMGVKRNGENCSIASKKSGKSLNCLFDRGMLQRNFYPDVERALTQIAQKHGMSGIDVVVNNGAVLNACCVLENPTGCYFKFPKPEQGGGSIWDFAATAALYTEAGAIVTDFYGGPLDLNRPDSTFMNHRGVLFTTNPALAADIRNLISLITD